MQHSTPGNHGEHRNQLLSLPDSSEIRVLEKMMSNGDAEAGIMLFKHYEFVALDFAKAEQCLTQ